MFKDKVIFIYKALLSHMPYIRNYKNCSTPAKTAAFWELLITLIISFLPIFIGCFIAYLQNNSIHIINNMYNNLSNGELFLYITSLLAPVIYMILKERKNIKRFPDLILSVFLYGGIVLASAIVFALKRINFAFDAVSVNRVQYLIFPFSLLLMYVVLTYNNEFPANPAEVMQAQEDKFTADVRKHRRKNND
ncbi:MAG: hypothetical protein A2509_09060 [Candidatus Edwardsbacteria bacterium RIFOXYD12_FULL_50_11]|uniref:Uncharacterized protein n=1 Tax=Candidatus Edwardsbacteria bacterium GWF2_54_11 TaxID=1817851 RepID=A0A1F5R1S5_9BACT|nr:MAG: hypothetical protein A2502_02425 [Candidatus Edwardsbacteria bacterium RifOxyC12_full_54_24]OGF08434.1 MAG: hypothetical protein A2024_06935 [Candidatus Edwardsbacteria bacterium GWF2_54_11]OGF09110.1 MAG: hypothetical protein A2273_10880 [Candidatus Edwardsbacteria bacterium RifOxyA12_full_54_48]OGF12365.1 MAG: hypothetical protein A3K15_00715 [Candidatus Edwardsbacteria bacterium GWE2_54_12]OGF17529.1 MAG: hypothetical protein A2509_09060 [Candidatus Edwardsbacteria bacterium RIFOXYD1